MRQHEQQFRTLLQIVTLVTMAAVLMPVAMPICVMASDFKAETSLPCHPPPPEQMPCHPADDTASSEPALDCCATTLDGLHEEGIATDRLESQLFVVLPLIITMSDADIGDHHSSEAVAAVSPPRAPVSLSILFRSLLN